MFTDRNTAANTYTADELAEAKGLEENTSNDIPEDAADEIIGDAIPDATVTQSADRNRYARRNAGAAGFISGGSPKINTVHNPITMWNMVRLDRDNPRINLNCQRLTAAAVDYVFGGHHPLDGSNVSFITSSMQRPRIGTVPTLREQAVKFTIPNRKTGHENQFVATQTLRSSEGGRVSSRNLIMMQYDSSAAILRMEAGQYLLLSYSKNRNMQFVAVFQITDLHELNAVDKSLIPEDIQGVANHYLVNARVVAAAMKTPAKNEQRWFENEDQDLMEDLIAQAYHKLDNPNDISGVERVWKGTSDETPTVQALDRTVSVEDLPYVITNTVGWMRENEIATKEREASFTRKIYVRLREEPAESDDDTSTPETMFELDVLITSTLGETSGNRIDAQRFTTYGSANELVHVLSEGDYRPIADWISDNRDVDNRDAEYEVKAQFLTSL